MKLIKTNGVRKMGWLLAGIVVVLGGAGIFIGIKKIQESRRSRHLRIVSQQIVTGALTNVLARFPQLRGLREVDSTTTAVWGTAVMLFEFVFEWQGGKEIKLPELRRQLTCALTTYAYQQQLEGFQGMPVFVISDMWLLKGELHVDVAYVVNRQTKEYLDDVNRVEH
ncbi:MULTISPECIES: hypothetical protein [unclassified Ligilactobacillus]|uniref:hypothetical protein n=1 Tax=unclassified Ligilactobacillus TaxID=2767920 RepID=UPI00385370DF